MTRIDLRRHGRRVAGVALVALLTAGPATANNDSAGAADAWPCWGGPNHDFKVDSPKLASRWPDDGPPKRWSRELGDGYAAVVSDGARLYTTYSVREKTGQQAWAPTGKEIVVALDAATGKTVWEYAYEDTWVDDMSMEFGPGPHATPLVHRGKVYAVGCTADLKCLDAATGKLLWERDLMKEFDASHLGRGYGASALALGDRIVLPVGGEGHSIIAFDAATGEPAWKNQDFGPTFATPMTIDVDGQRQLVVFTGGEVSGLNPSDGSLIWSHPHETPFGANISTPVWCDKNILFISSAYGTGAKAVKLTRDGDTTTPTQLWENNQVKIHHGNAIAVEGHVYVSSGDFGPTFLMGVNMETGKVTWKKRGFSKANFVYADGKLIILDEDGNLALARVSPKKFRERAKCEVTARNSWTVPTLVDGILYVRDRKTVSAFDLRADAATDAENDAEDAEANDDSKHEG